MKDYKKILEGVMNIINTTEKSDIGFVNICTYIGENCPELKESEDERIVKELLTFFRESIHGGHILTNKEYDSWIAWLEKQGEQKVSEYDVVKTIKERIIEHFDNHLIIDKCFSIGGLKYDILKIINEVKFEKQDEQTPIEQKVKLVYHKFNIGDIISPNVIDERSDMNNPDYTIVGFSEKYEDYLVDGGSFPSCSIGINFIDKNYHLKEQKSIEWSKADKRMKEAIIGALNVICNEKGRKYIYMSDSEGYILMDDIKCWLKSLKDRVQPQLKQKWSEDDEKIYQSIMDDTVQENQLNGKQTDWLRDIKYRYFPQPQQEWSEEEAKALNRISAILVDASEVKNWWKEYRLIERDEMIRLTDFLKSLRPQSHWKPSDEQMNNK